jgi:hypothetical protein
MKPSELLGLAVKGEAGALNELGRLLDSLLRLAGPGTYATRQTPGLVRLANDGESGPGMAVQGNDSRLVPMTTIQIQDDQGNLITSLYPFEVIDEPTVALLKELLIEQRKTRIALEILIGSPVELETADVQGA